MLIPPKYVFTTQISKSLQIIEGARSVISSFPIPQEIETNIRRESILKSSLFSARIEGNPLTLEELIRTPSKDQKKQEVTNIFRGLQLVEKRGSRDISLTFLKELHQKVMTGVYDPKHTGGFRTEVSAIFNTAGIAIYLPPPPKQIPALMERLIKFVNSDKEQFVPIRAVIAHYMFEKIHPFLDGNGRVGRLLLQSVLQKTGYGMKNLVTIEEYLDKYRTDYYDVLALGERDITEYIEFMLEALAVTAEKAQKLVMTRKDAKPEEYLLPRRTEIINLITEQKLLTFDQIKRRFLSINERTLRYDLKKLQDAGFIRKLGTTKGVYYELAKSV